MSEAPNTDVKTDAPDDFDKAFEAAAVAAEAQVQTPAADAAVDKTAQEAQAKTDADKAAADAAAAAATKTDAGKAADETAAKDAADKAAALAAETPEQKTARETAEAKTAKDAADAKIVADAALAVQTAMDHRDEAKARKQAEADALAASKQETLAQKTAREALEASIKPYEPTVDETAALEKFKTEFPTEYAAMEARLKGVDRDINARVHQAVRSVMEHMGQRLGPVEQSAGELGMQAHVTAIRTAHPDYDKVIANVPEWIKKQPAYLQPAMQGVYDSGDTQSVIQLVADYKASVTPTPDAAKLAADAAAKAATEAAAKKAADEAASLIPVGTKRTNTSPKGAPDLNDFDGAFAEASEALTAKK